MSSLTSSFVPSLILTRTASKRGRRFLRQIADNFGPCTALSLREGGSADAEHPRPCLSRAKNASITIATRQPSPDGGTYSKRPCADYGITCAIS